MDIAALNAAFQMETHTKKVGGIELEFLPLTASQRVEVYKYARDNGTDITHIQAMTICKGCVTLNDSHMEELKTWKPEVLSELSDFVQKISGVDKEASEEAEKN